MYKGKILKTGIRRANPFIFDMPVAGDHMVILQALDNLYTQEGQVFEGKISDQIALAQEAGISEYLVRRGFEDLQKYGHITIGEDENMFAPTDRMLERYLS